MRKLIALAAFGLVAGSVHAGTISENLNFSLSGFVDISGAGVPAPDPLITGSITVTYDPSLSYDNDTTDIVVHSLTGVTVDSTLGFTYQGGLLEFGGIQNDADYIYANTNDLVVAFNVSNPADPVFVPCSTPGYTCGVYTGSSLVDAAGYAVVGSNSAWFYGAPTSTVSSVPEPATMSLLAVGLAVVGFAARKRKSQR
jgi:hypothetical protein